MHFGNNQNGSGSVLKSLIILCTVAIVALAAACSASNDGDNNNDASDSDVLNVVTSFYPLYDFSQKIGGDYVNVTNLIPAGVDSHDWTPKPQDMVNILKADVLIYNGAGYEGWIGDFLKTLKADSALITVEATRGIHLIKFDEHGHKEKHAHEEEHGHDPEHEHEDEKAHDDDHAHEDERAHEHGEFDPHVWLSPKQAIRIAGNIKDSFIQADEAHRDIYTANYEQLFAQLTELDERLADIVANSPRNEIVVSHEAFGYIARDYGIVQVGVMGLTPDAEPTVQRMKEISDFVKEHDIQYILFEELVSPRLAQTLADSLNIETLVLNPLEGLTEQQIADGEDYVSIMNKNLTTLAKALQ